MALLLKDFRVFLFLVWQHLHLPDPTPVQYEIADYLQHGPKRCIIQGFRGVGKSWITSAYVVWRLFCDPQHKIMVVSASKVRADDFSTFTQRLINEMPLLEHLRSHGDGRKRKDGFDVGPARNAHAPSVVSKGITSQLTGGRATEIIADDVEVPSNSMTEDMRDKLLKTVSEFEAIIVPEIGRIKFLGTPQTEETVYTKLRQRGYKCRIWPGRYPTKEERSKVYGDALAPSILEAVTKCEDFVGHSTDPQRFTDRDLQEREASYGKSGFALQFMLNTSLSDAERYPLKLADLIVLPVHPRKAPTLVQWAGGPDQQIKTLPNIGFTGDRWYKPMFVDPEWVEFSGRMMSIDPSGRGKDELSYAIVNQLHGTLYLMDCGGLQGGYTDENLVTLARKAQAFEVNHIVVESNFGDGMFTKIFSPVLQQFHPCVLEEVRHNIQKEKRIIDTLEPIMNSHRLVINEQVIKADLTPDRLEEDRKLKYSLFYQMTRITKDRGSLVHDDRLDALAMAVAYWVDAMAQDRDKAEESHRSRVMDKELKEFMKHCVTSPVRRRRGLGVGFVRR